MNHHHHNHPPPLSSSFGSSNIMVVPPGTTNKNNSNINNTLNLSSHSKTNLTTNNLTTNNNNTNFPTPTITTSVAKAPAPKPQVSNEDRLAELRRKSELSKQNAKSKTKQGIEPVVETVSAEPVTVEPPKADPVSQEVKPEAIAEEATGRSVPQSKDVFKTIEATVAKTTTDRRRKRRRQDKKGGGRQKQEKKLNRQKYLEYKYAARDLLDNPSIPEEHRSNVLGQIWAKGERIGVADSLEFIDQKVLEEILPESVAQKLRDLVNKMTTRR